MTKTELQSYFWLKKRISRLEERLLELETSATRMTAQLTHDRRDGGPKDKLGDIVASMMAVQDQINDCLAEMYKKEKDIFTAMATLPEREQTLIECRYLLFMRWEEIAVMMSYSWPHVHRIHSNALQLLAGKDDTK